MKERPVLFSAPMVRAILEGTKTQTRRPYKNRKHPDFGCAMAAPELVCEPQHVIDRTCPYGQPGDRLWVREAWAKGWTYGGARRCVFYRATLDGLQGDAETGINHDPKLGASPPNSIRWRPSIHMPRWASRIILEVTAVRVERLQEISHTDAMAEGMAWDDAVYDYSRLWEHINGPGSWDANPWVWVITFRRSEQ